MNIDLVNLVRFLNMTEPINLKKHERQNFAEIFFELLNNFKDVKQ